MKDMIEKLYEINAVKFGNFTLKSGVQSPIYIDLRLIVSYPTLLQSVANAITEKTVRCNYDLLCGVPYTALPIATAISLKQNIPMVMRRKEIKDYGTKKVIEGAYQKNQICLIVEDLITSGASIMETIAPLQHEGLIVKDIAVLIDREQGGKTKLETAGYNLHSVLSITEILDVLHAKGSLCDATKKQVLNFVFNTQTR